MKNNKTAFLLRVAAIIMLVTLIIMGLLNITNRVIGEIYYEYYSGSFIHGIIRLIKDMTAENVLSLLNNSVIPITAMLAGIVLSAAIIVMLFKNRERTAGRFIIINAAVSMCVSVINASLFSSSEYFTEGEKIRNFFSYVIPSILYLIPLILLGLLLLGVFKKASKVFGFILLGLFAVVSLLSFYSFIEMVRIYISQYESGGYGGIYLVMVILNLTMSFVSIFNYIAYMLCSLGIALKPREKPEIPQDSTVTS